MLNSLFKDKLQTIDDLMIQAIRSVFEERIEQMRPGDEVPNAELGERYRAYLEAIKFIDQCFIDLASYKQIKGHNKTFNKER